MLRSIHSRFEAAFDIPFVSEYGLDGKNLWYKIGPKGNLRQFFRIHCKFVDDIRFTMELLPESYSVPFIHDLGQAPEESKKVFCSFAKEFQKRRAKIVFTINHFPADPCDYSQWPETWNHISLRISRSPIAEEPIDHAAIILDWGMAMAGMILSLANLVPLVPETELNCPQVEGGVHRELTTRYERSPVNRALCLASKGYSCAVCGMNFQSIYGDLGYNFIHVHHAIPVSAMGEGHMVDPIRELFPVCPNCHAMLHRRNPPIPVEELKSMLAVVGDK